MAGVTVEVSGHGRAGLILLEVRPGEMATFGRGSPRLPVDILIPDPAVSRLAGQVRPVEDYWLLSNHSADKTYVVENPEGAGEFVKVPPRRIGAPIPFEFARVVLPLAGGVCGFKVYAPAQEYSDARAASSGDGDLTRMAFPLDETSKYFLILVALCEPRLRDWSPIAVPTIEEVMERLRPLPLCGSLTRSAVNFHLDYLAGPKLRIKTPEAPAGRLEWKREAIVDTALRFNLVREDHLGLLPDRASHGAGGMR
jgi:hypothetical protein